MVEHVTKESFESSVLGADNAVIVDFYADWCGPCKRLAPVFEELSQEVSDVGFFKVDVDDQSELAGQFAVQSIPTLIIFKGGQPVERVMGAMPKDELKRVLEKHQ
ncbi:MAG: thioredoxin [Candidatus Woesearchaeota archaeon]